MSHILWQVPEIHFVDNVQNKYQMRKNKSYRLLTYVKASAPIA